MNQAVIYIQKAGNEYVAFPLSLNINRRLFLSVLYPLLSTDVLYKMKESVEKGGHMVKIGKKIQELRKQRHTTQEELGKAVGVSTQAVSKWECGGTPDTELLPLIADYFHVSIDYLYGRTLAEETNLKDYVYQQIHKLPLKDRSAEAYRIIFTLLNACSEVDDISVVMQSENMELYHKKDMDFQYEMATDHVIALMSLMDHLPYAVFLPEPEEGNLDMLLRVEDYCSLFDYLSKEHHLKILIELYQKKPGYHGVTSKLLAKRCGLPQKEVKEILNDMVRRDWVISIEVETEQENEQVFIVNMNFAFLAMLIFAKEFSKKKIAGYTIVTREKPILTRNQIKDET